MAAVTPNINQDRAMRIAVKRIEGFAKQFGQAHQNLALHAAFPLVLTPDLLYQIWANFLPEAPWTAVAHVLLSRLCRQVGYEMYEIDIADRNLLLRELKEQFGQKRLDELGEFLIDYVAQRLTGDDPETRDLAEAQEWTALAYTKPDEAARQLAESLRAKVGVKPEDMEDIGEVLRLTSLVETFAEPLTQEGFEPLLIYSRGMANFVRGNLEEAKNQFNKIRRQKSELKVAGVKLDTPVDRKIPFVLPQLGVSTFTGREEVLKQLEELLLNRQGEKICSIASLSGIGGVGKSALACHFATIHKDDFPDGVIGLRVDGKEIDAIAREFARRCDEEIDSEDERDASNIMQEVFAHRRMLLIFDNAEEASIRSLLPGGERCAVIVTARDRGLLYSLDIPQEAQINLDSLPDLESLTLLKILIGEERVAAEQEAARNLIHLGGRLPLAIQIIGAALKQNNKRTLADYVASLSKEKQRLRFRAKGDSHSDLRACFSLSLKQFQSEEVDFFACLSVCAKDGFSRQAAMAASGFDDEYDAQEYLDSLCRLSLLNYAEVGENRFVFHPLIHLFAHDIAIERGLYENAVERHAQFFIRLVGESESNPFFATSVVAELESIILAINWLQHVGKFDEAVVTFKQVVKIGNALNDRRSVAIGLNGLAEIFQQQGKLDEAAATFQQVVAISQALDDQLSVAIGLNGLAGIFQQQGKLDDAAATFQQVVKIGNALNDRRSVAIGLNGLAGVFQQQGKLDDAAATFQQVIEINQDLNDRQQEAIGLNGLAGIFQQQNKLDEAATTFKQVVKISQALNDQRSAAIGLNGLARVLQQQNKLDEAVATFQQVVEISQALNDRRSAAIGLNGLARVLQQQNKLDKAVATFQQVVEISQALSDRRQEAIALHRIAGILKQKHKWHEAEKFLRYSYDLSQTINDRRLSAIILNSLGQVLSKQQNPEKFKLALMYFRESIKLGQELDDQLHLAQVHTAMGQALLRQGEIKQAAIQLIQGFEIDENSRNRSGLEKVTPHLTFALEKLGRRNEALAYSQRALAVAPKSRELQQVYDRLSSPIPLKQGTVKHKRYNSQQGFYWGHITPSDGTPDIYFREGFIDSDCIAQLEPGSIVEVEVQQNSNGPCAKYIRVV
ncbi:MULTISPECIES: tetratricopeptide repeat protein [unclassified Microcoleus]|uniref:tetratricopeptide repeat protein n=1 Tax=unclassified Microcoleus TaxID=2642155 RepID=UPI0025DD7D87|nr:MULTISPECIES: tetratricopeptide repeat protein [unclassified Microcoleus]